MSRRVFINLLAFLGVFFLMLWWAINNIINPTQLPLVGSASFFDQPYELKGEFAATAGVAPNSEVAYLGVNYGDVSSVESVDGKVVITMDIDKGKGIPVGSTARIFRKSAIGEPYIDFVPPATFTDSSPMMEPGTVIPLSRTSVPLEFSELLRAASRVLGAVEPEQTRTLIHELAVALQGNGQTLRDLTVDSDALLDTFAQNSDLLDSLSSNATRLTRTVTERRESLSSAIADLADLSETLRTSEPDTRILLDRGTQLLGTTADLVADIEGDLDCVLKDLDDVITATSTDTQIADLSALLDTGPTGFGFVWNTRDTEPGGLWVRIALLVNPENPPGVYIPPTELPAVPEVPACVSSLSSGGVRFEAAGATSTPTVAAASLPATGGRPLWAGTFLLLAAAALAVVARRNVAS